MKKILFLVIFSTIYICKAQEDCQELFISEVVYSKDTTNAILSTIVVENYSLEIYNPTSATKSLIGYEIHLIPQNGLPTIINLGGSINAKETYVISKYASDTDLTSVADIITPILDYDNFISIELYKDSLLIDKVGENGLFFPDNIDISQAILNPSSYLSTLNIDLRSIESMNFRRSPLVTLGDPLFGSVGGWYVVQNNDFNDINHHLNACNTNEIIVSFMQETYFVQEGQSVPLFLTIENYDSSSHIPVITSAVKLSNDSYSFISSNFYIDSLDFLHPSVAINQPPFAESFLVETYNDHIVEPVEIVFYELTNALNAKVNPARKFAKVVITDSGLKLSDIGLDNSNIFKIVPNPTQNYLFIQSNIDIQNVSLYDITGRLLISSKEMNLDLSKFPDGIYSVAIEVNSKIYVRKVIKN